MTIIEIHNMIADNLTAGELALILIVLSSLIEVSKIKINPWSSLFTWIGTKLNTELSNKVDGLTKTVTDVEEKVTLVNKDLQAHITDSWRSDILDFQNTILQGRLHTKEEFKFIYKICDSYENYVHENNLTNSEATDAIKYIRYIYKHQLKNGAFVIDGKVKTNFSDADDEETEEI